MRRALALLPMPYDKGVRDEDIMRHTHHRDVRTMRGYAQLAGLLTDSPG
jgi:hypothetical protein